MAHLLETSIINLSTLIMHEAEKKFNNEKHQKSLEELAEIARRLAMWSSKYSPKEMSFEKADNPHLIMAKVLKGAVKSLEVNL